LSYNIFVYPYRYTKAIEKNVCKQPVSAAPLQLGAGTTRQATGKASKLSGVKGDSKEPFKALCSANLKKLGGEKEFTPNGV
jgi:hypothetical protein